MKAKKFYNKDGEILWIDDLGYVYCADKLDMPNKHNKEEWEKFHNNEKSILVKYVLATPSNPYGNSKIEWFESKESFLQFYNSEKQNVLTYAVSPSYEILRNGYYKLKPEERKSVLRLPYINLDMELGYGTSVADIALSWSKMCNRSWQGNGFNIYDYLINIINNYQHWLSK